MKVTIHLADFVSLEVGKANVIGIFEELVAPTYPASQPRMHGYIKIAGEPGDKGRKFSLTGKLLHVVDSRTEREIHSFEGEYNFSTPPKRMPPIFLLNAIMDNITFPEEGMYAFRILMDGEAVGEETIFMRVQE